MIQITSVHSATVAARAGMEERVEPMRSFMPGMMKRALSTLSARKARRMLMSPLGSEWRGVAPLAHRSAGSSLVGGRTDSVPKTTSGMHITTHICAAVHGKA